MSQEDIMTGGCGVGGGGGKSWLQNIQSKKNYLFAEYVPDKLLHRIQVDDVALYSITEGSQAKIITEEILLELKRVEEELGEGAVVHRTITDATACVGGNTISFAGEFENVNAVEIDVSRGKMLDANMRLLGLSDKVSVYAGHDYRNIMMELDQEAIFIDPPWGGVGYRDISCLDMFLGETDVVYIIRDLILKRRASVIAMKVPVNYNMRRLFAVLDGIEGVRVSKRVVRLKKMDLIVLRI
jgi:predicted RNA methylase